MKITNLGFTEDNELKINVGSVHNIDRIGFENYLKLDNPYFLSCEFDSDGDFTLFYDFSEKTTVKKFLSKEIGRKDACEFLKSLADVMIEAENLNMDENCILMNANAMFYDEAEKRISVVYIPLIEGITPTKTLRLFLKEILINMLYKESDDMTWLGNIIRYISRNRKLSAVDFRNFVISQEEEKAVQAYETVSEEVKEISSEPIPAAAPVETASPVPQPEKSTLPVTPAKAEDEEVKGFLTRLNTKQGYQIMEGETTIGKSEDNTISIPDNRAISRKHAVVIKVGYAFMIKDCGSTNKTYVNGVALESGVEKDLNSGDRIHFGNEEFLFTIVE